jgi:hypothetical protein
VTSVVEGDVATAGAGVLALAVERGVAVTPIWALEETRVGAMIDARSVEMSSARSASAPTVRA